MKQYGSRKWEHIDLNNRMLTYGCYHNCLWSKDESSWAQVEICLNEWHKDEYAEQSHLRLRSKFRPAAFILIPKIDLRRHSSHSSKNIQTKNLNFYLKIVQKDWKILSPKTLWFYFVYMSYHYVINTGEATLLYPTWTVVFRYKNSNLKCILQIIFFVTILSLISCLNVDWM